MGNYSSFPFPVGETWTNDEQTSIKNNALKKNDYRVWGDPLGALVSAGFGKGWGKKSHFAPQGHIWMGKFKTIKIPVNLGDIFKQNPTKTMKKNFSSPRP